MYVILLYISKYKCKVNLLFVTRFFTDVLLLLMSFLDEDIFLLRSTRLQLSLFKLEFLLAEFILRLVTFWDFLLFRFAHVLRDDLVFIVDLLNTCFFIACLLVFFFLAHRTLPLLLVIADVNVLNNSQVYYYKSRTFS